MSAKDQPGPSGGRAWPGGGGAPPDPSRRAVLRGAASAGVAGVAASTLIGLPASQALASTARPAARPGAGREPAADRAAGGAEQQASDVVVHLRDIRSGEMDIFSGTSMTRLTDPDLASRVLRAIR